MSLVLSTRQIDSLAVDAFLDRVAEVIASADPAAPRVLGTPEGRATLRAQADKALAYGLTTELDCGRYIVTAWLLGTDFDSRLPAMAEILAEPRLTPTAKADALERITGALFATLGGAHGR